ncbi:DUF2064 domain-containing protein [Flavobacterium sp. 7A]|uniref:DUF2064 domain-containing protein n=1 Tax=Flavobacterium sp. 7A TaxID=2940571 RepID=UPI0022279D9E|nr:DUF2064 domain-containing protein [Flavobacterium sp. 7A]MCW2120921.1 glycosyltransferase A (GT-A) superfamily protein (DUF2064 family) [Flavobacterium sp. 7A]
MNAETNLNSTTAILLFAQTEQAEAATKKISSYTKNNILLWKKLNSKVIQTVKKTKLPYFISDETTQVGSNFGYKITAAVQNVFDQGFENVIVIGNDSLALTTSLLLNAAQNLQNKDIVLGADWHGGVYLMGLSKRNFNASVFEKIEWQTNSVFKNLTHIFQQQTIFHLPRLQDCNDKDTFQDSISSLGYASKLRAYLMALVQERLFYFLFEKVSYFSSYTTTFYNKGSPVAI